MPDDGQCKFWLNPILPDCQADLLLRVWERRWWIYPSNALSDSQHLDLVDWHVFSSTNQLNWQGHGLIFSLKEVVWAEHWAWAADCRQSNGRFYFQFTVDDQIVVAIAKAPWGPFRDALGRPLLEWGADSTRVTDLSVLMDDNGGPTSISARTNRAWFG